MSHDFISFSAPAKINTYLKIVGRKEDGYHLLDSDFRMIDLCDEIEIQLREDGQLVHLNPIEGVAPDMDLTIRAALALKQYSATPLGMNIRVHKKIPMGGGLGGGSSDAATVLLALNTLWNLNYSREVLMNLGLSLGADVPFFIFGHTAQVTGVGEFLKKINKLPAWYVLVHPGVHISTPKIFKNFAKKVLTGSTSFGIIRSINSATQQVNDLQAVVVEEYKDVQDALSVLEPYGSPLMTGSGSCVFLECASEEYAQTVNKVLPESFVRYVVRGLDQHPSFGSI